MVADPVLGGRGPLWCYACSAVPFGVAWWEILLILLLVLLVFGPKRLPEMGRSLGRGFREFKESITGQDKDEEPPGELPPAETAETESEQKTAPRERDPVS
jgi:sec-independent protein translocase protein TatA